jgi:hypothetical protein
MDEKRLSELLARAASVVEAADLPDDLRAPAYTAAVGFLAGGRVPEGGAAGGQSPPAGGLAPAGGSSPAGVLDRIAAGMAIDPKEIRKLYEEMDGAPVLNVKSSRLPKSKAAGAHDVALLVMAARQLGGIEEYTEAKVLRDGVKRYAKFDQGNFGKHMTALDNLILTSGSRSTAKRKLTQPGIEAAAELAKAYLAGSTD